jgi:hypothetical protein
MKPASVGRFDPTTEGSATLSVESPLRTAEQEIQRDHDGKRVLLCFQAMFFWHG